MFQWKHNFALIVYFTILNIDSSTCFLKLWKGLNHLHFNLLRQFTFFFYSFSSVLVTRLGKNYLFCFENMLYQTIFFVYIIWVSIEFCHLHILASIEHFTVWSTLWLIFTFLRCLAKILLWPLKNIFTISSF